MRPKVICLENMPFQSPIRVGSHHYAEHFSRDCDVLWISLPWHWLQRLRNADNNRYAHYNRGRPVPINEHLQALVPFTLVPYRRGFPFSLGFNVDHYSAFMLPRMRGLLREYGFDRVDLVWISDPRHISILRHVHYRKLAYRCVDNLEHFPDVPSNLRHREIKLARMCDAVFCTSKELITKLDALGARCHYLPNGVDYKFFANPMGNSLPALLKEALHEDSSRNVVYMGAIAEWFDFDALRELAQVFPEHRFIIVGPQRVRPDHAMRQIANVTFVGPLDYSVLPDLLARCRVGLIPFKINPITDFVNPIKLFEYAAAGLEVVCSAMKTVLDLNSPAWLYEQGGIVTAFRNALAAQVQPNRSVQVREFARINSWSARFDHIVQVLDLVSG